MERDGIHKATINDLDALLPLVNGYREFYKREPNPDASRAFLVRHLTDGTSIIYIAMRDGTAAGFAQIFPTFSTVRLAPMLILEDLFVDPKLRGGGIATSLLVRAMEYAKEIGAGGMFLETARDNETAQHVYESAGWTREGEFYKYNAPI